MSHFYGIVKGGRGEATRTGHKTTGLETTAATWSGAIHTTLYVDDSGRDRYRVEQIPWDSKGAYRLIAEGFVGESIDEEYARTESERSELYGIHADEVPF
jgi:hypothetical protein